jgi:hypothetical protein
VPRSRTDGFDYFPQSNSIAFFGSYRPRSGGESCTSNAVCGEGGLCEQGACKFPVQIAVHYETFIDKTKCPPVDPDNPYNNPNDPNDPCNVPVP